MIIRKAIFSDIKSIMDILQKVVPLMNREGNYQWDSKYPNERVFEEDIRSEQLWVAELNNTIAGFAAITTDQEPEYAEVGWNINETAIVTHRLAVDLEFRGYGIAVALLNKAEEIALKKNIRFLRIDTNTNNQITNKLFPKCGYIFSGEIGLHFRPGLRFYCYQKILG